MTIAKGIINFPEFDDEFTLILYYKIEAKPSALGFAFKLLSFTDSKQHRQLSAYQ